MSYAIGNVIYGFAVDIRILFSEEGEGNEEDPDFDNATPRQIDAKADEHGLTTLYSANGETPYYCGVELAKVSECGDIRLRELLASAEKKLTPELKKKADDLIAALPEKARRQPDIWIVWSSS